MASGHPAGFGDSALARLAGHADCHSNGAQGALNSVGAVSYTARAAG